MKTKEGQDTFSNNEEYNSSGILNMYFEQLKQRAVPRTVLHIDFIRQSKDLVSQVSSLH